MDNTTLYDENAKQWSCAGSSRLFDINCSIGQIAYFMMKSKPAQEICQISDTEGTTLTYGTAITYAVRIAQYLQKEGLTHDEIVGVIAPNTTLLLPLAIGCFLNGTPFHAINPIHEAHVIGHLYTITKPKIIFCDGKVYEKVKAAYENSELPKIFTLCNHLQGVHQIKELLEPTETELFYQPKPLRNGPTQTVALCCSSGTMGLPKAVTIANSNLTYAIGFVNGSDVLLAVGTLDWLSGLLNIVFVATVGGKRVITTKPFLPNYLLELVSKYQVSFIHVDPLTMAEVAQLPQYTKEAMKNLKLIFMGGASIKVSTLELIRSKLSGGILLNGYGCTELGAIAGNISSYKPKSVGKIQSNTTIKIVNLENGVRLGPNEIGEVCILNNGKWLGYYGNEKATREVHDSDGWFCTGDLGYFDDEHYLHLVDRCKDVLKYKGMQFIPNSIEETIAELPDVLDVCVFGISDEIFGDMAAAAVVKRNGSDLSTAQIVAYVARKQQVEHKRLHAGVVFVSEIFRNANRKLLRKKVKETYQFSLSN